MNDIVVETGFQSLQDLAGLDTSDYAVLTSRVPPAGLYVVTGEAKLIEGTSDDPAKPPLHSVQFEYEIMRVDSLVDKNLNPEDLLNRKLNERYTFWPTNFRELVGLLRGRYKMAGFPYEGKLGGLPDSPGMIDTIATKPFMLKVRNFTDKNGVDRAGFDWAEFKGDEEEAEVAA